jgi:1-acyl-sn-glycerol-3-phosphate acyltransferase
MLFLRSLLYFIGSIIGVILISFCGIFLIFSNYEVRYRILSKWAVFCIWWLKVTLNISFKVIGTENIDKPPFIIVSNHQSTWETLGFQTILPPHTWVLKKELLWIPIFGWAISLLKPIIIDRGDKLKAIKKVITQGKDRLNKGISVVIFPEGTRQPVTKLGDYQNGAVAIAKGSGYDILPIYHDAGKLWPKGSFIKKPGVITVTIGKPMSSSNGSTAEITDNIRNWALEQSRKIQ